MNALVKKEVRLLLPSFAIAGSLTAANLFLPSKTDELGFSALQLLLPFFFCPVMAVMLALASFGSEISAGTFSLLLAQPVPRQKIWETKVSLLAVAMFLLGLLWCGFAVLRLKMIHHPLGSLEMISAVAVFGLAAFSGGLWAVLLLRQVAAAFWFTILVPGALLVLLAALAGDGPDEYGQLAAVIVLGLYSLAGFFFARRLFLRAQDVQWSGGTVAMPELRGRERGKTEVATRRGWRPWAALLLKELQFHQAQFLIAGALLVLHLGTIATRKLGQFRRNSDIEFVLESVWMLWLVLPLLVGCAAVAEERRLGTHEGQLCLPAGRRVQFTVKLLVVLGLSLCFGAILPVLLEGTRILPAAHAVSIPRLGTGFEMTTGQFFFLNCLGTLYAVLPWLTLAGMAILIGGVAFYASTLMRNTLQTLAPAVTGIAVAWFLIMVAWIPWPWQYTFEFLWSGPLAYFIALPLVAATLLWLAYGNYQRVQTDWALGGRNLLALTGALCLGVAATCAIYHRAWEKLTPFEPPHGLARLTVSEPPQLTSSFGMVAVRFSDGKIWTASPTNNADGAGPITIWLSDFRTGLKAGQLLAGSNWVSACRVAGAAVALKADGTLWLSQQVAQRDFRGRWELPLPQPFPLVQFGTETNWSSEAPLGYSVLLVKKDGTLWRWGPSDFDFRRNQWPGLQAFTPRRLGTDSDWAAVQFDNYQRSLRKMDGSVWDFTWSAPYGLKTIELEPGFWVFSMPEDKAADFLTTATLRSGSGLEFRVGVPRDGTFRIWAEEYWLTNNSSRATAWKRIDERIGAGTNWLAVAGYGNNIVTLKTDGTLWRWNVRQDYFDRSLHPPGYYERKVLDTVPSPLGTHSDWVAVTSYGDEVISLAKDGSLWYWPLDPVGSDDFYGFGSGSLLDRSHKPQLLGNVFTANNL
jgi:hypothetical protein